MSPSSKRRRLIGKRPFIKGLRWWSGKVITVDVPQPYVFELKPYQPASPDENQYMAGFIETNPPIWSDALIEAIRSCGVTNFDTYPIEIINPSNSEVLKELREMGINCFDDSYLDPGGKFTNYKAVNIFGLVTAADMTKSIATVHDGIPLIDVDFDELVIDEKKTKNLKMFRLAESTNSILVHESIRDMLIEKGFGPDVTFYNLKDAAL